MPDHDASTSHDVKTPGDSRISDTSTAKLGKRKRTLAFLYGTVGHLTPDYNAGTFHDVKTPRDSRISDTSIVKLAELGRRRAR